MGTGLESFIQILLFHVYIYVLTEQAVVAAELGDRVRSDTSAYYCLAFKLWFWTIKNIQFLCLAQCTSDGLMSVSPVLGPSSLHAMVLSALLSFPLSLSLSCGTLKALTVPYCSASCGDGRY